MILGTSFLIDLFDGEEAAFKKGVQLSKENVVQRVPSPVVTELSYGAEFGDKEEKRQVRNALHMYPIVEQDAETAHLSGELLAMADSNGESGVGWIDAMIAAVAERYDEPVLTNNIRDFERLDVEVEAYKKYSE